MNTDSLLPILQAAPFFQPMALAHLRRIADLAQEMTFEKGHFLLVNGKPANQFFLVLEGKVAIEIASADLGPVSIQSLRRDDIVGWSWLQPPCTWQFDALAVEPTRTLAFDAVALRELCQRDHEFGYELALRVNALIADRLRATQKHLLKLYN